MTDFLLIITCLAVALAIILMALDFWKCFRAEFETFDFSKYDDDDEPM